MSGSEGLKVLSDLEIMHLNGIVVGSTHGLSRDMPHAELTNALNPIVGDKYNDQARQWVEAEEAFIDRDIQEIDTAMASLKSRREKLVGQKGKLRAAYRDAQLGYSYFTQKTKKLDLLN